MSSVRRTMVATAMGLLIWTSQGYADYKSDCSGEKISKALPNACSAITLVDGMLQASAPPSPFVEKELQSYSVNDSSGGGGGGSVVLPPSGGTSDGTSGTSGGTFQ